MKSENVDINDVKKIIKEKNKDIVNDFLINGISYSIREGKYGPYISYRKGKKLEFKSIPKNYKVSEVKEKDILDILNKKS